ncbi:MAG: hypothetical protein AAFZ01_14275 [Pseudomonadota bacterium]
MGSNDFTWVGALGGVNLFFFAWSATGATELLAREHGVLEIAQLVLIALAFLMFAATSARSERAARTAAIALLGLSVLFFYRELDLSAFGVEGALAKLSQSNVRDVVVGIGTAGLLGYIIAKRADWSAWWRFATRAAAWPLFGTAIALVIGMVLSTTLKGDLQGQFWEELVEFNGYVFFLLAAGRHGALAAHEQVVERPIMPN